MLRERFGDKVQIRFLSPSRGTLLSRLFGRQPFSQESLLDPAEALGAIEARAAWARLGL